MASRTLLGCLLGAFLVNGTKMKLTSKLIVGGSTLVAVIVMLTLVVFYKTMEREGLAQKEMQLKTVLKQAESVKEHISQLSQSGGFDFEKLVAEAKGQSDYRDSVLYQTIPVVAAWKTIEKVAAEDGMTLRTPKFQPRNPKNQPTEAEGKIIKLFRDEGLEEYSFHDTSSHEMLYARPVVLSNGCLVCHGDPSNSPTGDGKDVLGFDMEGWKAGEVHGAFVLKASTQPIYEATHAAFGEVLIWVVPLCLITGYVTARLLKKRVVAPIENAIDNLAESSRNSLSTSREVTKSSSELADGASRQAAALEETSASIEEISGATERNLSSTMEASHVSRETREGVDRAVEGMNNLRIAMENIEVSGGEISNIIKSIEDIAFQTNLLALNAAVEAARAGEAGAGFSVVADEVRQLAMRAAEAAQDSSEKIKRSVQSSEEGKRLTNSVEQNLGGITSKVHLLDDLLTNLQDESSRQSRGLQQVSSSVSEIDKVTQHCASGSEELAAASHEMSEQSKGLREAIESLRNVINGGSGDTSVSKRRSGAGGFDSVARSGSRGSVPVSHDAGWN